MCVHVCGNVPPVYFTTEVQFCFFSCRPMDESEQRFTPVDLDVDPARQFDECPKSDLGEMKDREKKQMNVHILHCNILISQQFF